MKNVNGGGVDDNSNNIYLNADNNGAASPP